MVDLLSNIQTGVKAEACSMLRCKICVGLQKGSVLWLSRKQSGYFSGTPYIALCWLSPWHDYCCEIEQRWGAMHGMLCLQAWLHLLTRGDKGGSCDAGTRSSMRVRLQITMQTSCSTTLAFRSGQFQLFPQISGWCPAWSLSNRSTPTICMYAFIEPADKKKLPDLRAHLVIESTFHFIDGCTGMCLAKFLPTLITTIQLFHRLQRMLLH